MFFTLLDPEDRIQHFIAQLKQQVDLKRRDSCRDELLYKQIIKYAVCRGGTYLPSIRNSLLVVI